MTAPAPLLFGRQPLTIDDVVAIAERRLPVALDDSNDYRAAIAAGAEVQSDASGKAIPKAAGVANGIAWDAATAPGELIRIVRGI